MEGISINPINDFDTAVRLLSGGTNVAIYNDLGLPSIYVRRDKGAISDVIAGGPDVTHYAFKVNGVEVPAFYMGKYLATVYKGRALSLPLQDPAVTGNIDAADIGAAPNNIVTFDNAKIWCEANGAGFHLPTIAEYAWIALLSRKNGTLPRGNDFKGKASYFNHEKGLVSKYNNDSHTLTGSGPATWNDNWKPDGICDLTGNVNEWQAGYRTVDGEIQIFPDNDAAMHVDQTASSTLWKAILQDGTLVAPGTKDSLKWDYTMAPAEMNANNYRLNDKIEFNATATTTYGMTTLDALEAADGVNVPDRLKALALMPDGTGGSYGNATTLMQNKGEYRAFRGGYYSTWPRTAGAFYMEAERKAIDETGNRIGFRPAFIPGI